MTAGQAPSFPVMTGFADEAAAGIDGQIEATRALGWRFIEARNVDGKNIHDMPDAGFDRVCEALEGSGVEINCFGSTIANWGKSVRDPFDITLAEVDRAIPRMRRLGTRMIRIMSYAVLPGLPLERQEAEERFRRLREIQKRFADAGIRVLHENCQNYGGMGWQFTLRMLEAVPGLELVFDTANPVNSLDYGRPAPYPMQSSWEFYEHVRDHVTHLHVKDSIFIEMVPGATFPKSRFTYPGEGHGDVRRILKDMLSRGYGGSVSIEPHMAVVFHESSPGGEAGARRDSYIEYGRRTEAMIRGIVDEIARGPAR
ncbi:MAG: sugar phosphate isomerase/epimerase [Lentisphaerae bacterium]|nr:sugar phosphate isomerase/epimerase [Lentisphaerota bacterium]